MQDRRTDRWARCPKCGHKLFKVLETNPAVIEVTSRLIVDGVPETRGDSILETKCHSCKEIVDIRLVEI
jgi:phage FluMu protein Com